jgi:hypothetical protein
VTVRHRWAGFAGGTRAELLIDPLRHYTVRHTFVRANAPLPLNASRFRFLRLGRRPDRWFAPALHPGVNKKNGDQNGDL